MAKRRRDEDDDIGGELDLDALMREQEREQEAARNKPLEVGFEELEDEHDLPGRTQSGQFTKPVSGVRLGQSGLDAGSFQTREDKEAAARAKRAPRITTGSTRIAGGQRMALIEKVRPSYTPYIVTAVVVGILCVAGATGVAVWRMREDAKARAEIERINASDEARRAAEEERLRKLRGGN